MKPHTTSERKNPSFKSYTITGSIIYTVLFLAGQFLIKPLCLKEGNFNWWDLPRSYVQIILATIILLIFFIRNILCIKKDYSCREDYNQKAAGLMIAYTAVLLLIVLFVW